MKHFKKTQFFIYQILKKTFFQKEFLDAIKELKNYKLQNFYQDIDKKDALILFELLKSLLNVKINIIAEDKSSSNIDKFEFYEKVEEMLYYISTISDYYELRDYYGKTFLNSVDYFGTRDKSVKKIEKKLKKLSFIVLLNDENIFSCKLFIEFLSDLKDCKKKFSKKNYINASIFDTLINYYVLVSGYEISTLMGNHIFLDSEEKILDLKTLQKKVSILDKSIVDIFNTNL